MRYFRLAAKAPTLVNPASMRITAAEKINQTALSKAQRAESIKAARFPASATLSFICAGFY